MNDNNNLSTGAIIAVFITFFNLAVYIILSIIELFI